MCLFQIISDNFGYKNCHLSKACLKCRLHFAYLIPIGPSQRNCSGQFAKSENSFESKLGQPDDKNNSGCDGLELNRDYAFINSFLRAKNVCKLAGVLKSQRFFIIMML